VHAFNYANLPIYDILLGTYKNPVEQEPTLGFFDGGSRARADAPRARQHASACPRLTNSYPRKGETNMATACLLIGFTRPIPGHESEAWTSLFDEGVGQLDRFKKEGWFESYELIGLTPHGGNLNSFALIKGERAKLDELRRTDAFERFSMRLFRVLEGYGVVPGVTLEGFRKVQERNPDLFK
jgi:hypothetical protein